MTAPARASKPAPAERPGAHKWQVFAVVAVGVYMATLDSSIVNVSLPYIARAFHVPLGGPVEWIIIAYLVMIAALLMSLGRLADITGRKPLWVVGLALFTLGSGLCGLSPSLGLLVAARAFQGIGGATLMAISPAMLTAAFPPQERGRALGLNALVVGLGISTGPTLGGILTERLSWRWIFFVNLPIGVIGCAAALILLEHHRTGRRGRFDPFGATLLGLCLAAFTGGISFGHRLGWGSWLFWSVMALAAASFAAMLVVERRHPQPVLELSLWKDRVFASATGALVLAFLALFAVSFMMPFYLQQLRGFGAEKTGLILTALTVTYALLSPASGSLSDRIGSRWLAAIGMAICCGGLVSVGALGLHSPLWAILGALGLTGVGQAAFMSPNNSALMGAAPKEHQGTAAGVLATGRVIGQSLSVAISGSIFSALGGSRAGRMLTLHRGGPEAARWAHAFQHAFAWAFGVCTAVAAVGIVASLVRGKK